MVLTTWNEVHVLPEHAELLEAQAIPAEAALRYGIRSITKIDELPEEFHGQFKNAGEAAFPMLLFPWEEPDGTVRNQVKLPAELAERFDSKYMWAKGAPARLGVVRKAFSDKALIVEGTKQSLSAGHYAPDDYSVYGIGGCRLWSEGGVPSPHLSVFEDKNVVIMLDADASSNRDVYDAGVKLRDALVSMYGASDVTFVRLTGGKSAGLDDVLGMLKPETRANTMSRMISTALKMPKTKREKPADAKPNPKEKKPDTLPEWSGDRYNVVVNGDARQELNGILDGVKRKWDGRKVFNFGGAITRLKNGRTTPQSKNMWKSTVAEACNVVSLNSKGEYSPAHPSTYSIDSSYARFDEFTMLLGVKHAPFVRKDGTICNEEGYDPKSKMYLYPSEDLKDLHIPETPTKEEVDEARIVVEDWLHDFRNNVPSDADRANMIALAITPFVRLLLPSCPMAVINGLQMGVGKNLLADGISIVYNGERMDPSSLVLDEEEQRKQLTTTFQRGGDFFLFDETHTISGKHLARALTAPTWVDRILGTNNMVESPNNATWIALGNNVRVEGDLQRRVYPINLRPNTPDPQNRTDNDFRHPDFRAYTHKNRRKILVAILTMVRGWFAAGRPAPKRAITFGSFEIFEKTLGGILENAGIHGFLENRKDFAQESSFEMQHWMQHLSWLSEMFGEETFTTKQVREGLLGDLNGAEPPPGLEDPAVKTYTRQLGVAYAKINERFIDGFRLVKEGSRSRATLWKVEVHESGSTPPPAPETGGDDDTDGNGGGGTPPQAPQPQGPTGGYAIPFETEYTMSNVEDINVFDVLGGMTRLTTNKDNGTTTLNEDIDMMPEGKVYDTVEEMFADLEEEDDPFAPEDPEERAAYDLVAEYGDLVWDIETRDSNELFSAPKGEFLTLGGYQGDEDDNVITEDGGELAAAVEKSDRNYGFNHLGFDIPALAQHHNGDFLKMTEGAVDLMLVERQINPTDAKGVKPGYYGLDQTAKRYGHEGKTDDLKKLKKEYGSFEAIPKDVLEPYLHGDLEATRFLKDKIAHHYDTDPYVPREHEVQRRVNYGPRMVGFRVDLDELSKRLQEGEDRKANNLARLADTYGMPTHDAKGKEFRSPWASGPGKKWLEEVFKDLGATHMRRTEKTGDISTNKDNLEAAVEFYSDPERMKSKGINPDNVNSEGIREVCEMLTSLTGERTVYQTIENHRVGDRVHPSISPDQASGRWSVKNPGLTVLGKRGGKHVERGVLLPDEGEVLVAIDLDQVDARAIAAHSGDPAYSKLFEPGKDLHSTNAELAFGRSDKEWRDRAKILGHGFNYGMGPKGAAAQTGMDIKIAERFHQMMMEEYPVLNNWKNQIRAQAENGMLLDNGFGRKMKCNPERAYTQAPALVGQGATRDIIAEGILRLDMDLVRKMKVIVHDEIVFSLPESTWESDVERIMEAMQFEVQFNGNKPMSITAGVSEPGKNWADVYAG